MAQDDPFQTDYTPKSHKAEIHITYRCSLACRHCNRASYLRRPHTPDMTLAQVARFVEEARALAWYPWIVVIGGEPTLHPELDAICKLLRAFANEGTRVAPGKRLGGEAAGQGVVQMWSNQTTEESRAACRRVSQQHAISLVEQTIKQPGPGGTLVPVQIGQRGGVRAGQYEFDIRDMAVSPADLFGGLRPHCWQHSAEICGVSVDAGGYALCALGGAIAGVLGDGPGAPAEGARTDRLADLFDEARAAEMTAAMCRHCGSCLSRTGLRRKDGDHVPPDAWRAEVEALPLWRGMPVSETWQAALEATGEAVAE